MTGFFGVSEMHFVVVEEAESPGFETGGVTIEEI
jgi:hypothetical protein